MREWLGRVKATWSWARFAWQLAAFFGISGALTSIGGSVWAVILGVPIPIALMVGYCTLVGAVYLAMAPLAFRAFNLAQSAAPNPKPVKPNYTAYKHLNSYELQDAAKLWVDIDPHTEATVESAGWYDVFVHKIQSGDLKIVYKSNHPENRIGEALSPNFHTKIKKESLKQFAKDNGYDPRFLRDNPG